MTHIREVLRTDKHLSNIYRDWLKEDLKFYTDLRFRHQNNSEIEKLCVVICKGIQEEIKFHHEWDEFVEKYEGL